jgi:hypothetical protein
VWGFHNIRHFDQMITDIWNGQYGNGTTLKSQIQSGLDHSKEHQGIEPASLEQGWCGVLKSNMPHLGTASTPTSLPANTGLLTASATPYVAPETRLSNLFESCDTNLPI